MSTVLSAIAIVIGLLILGALISLAALLPPIRRGCRRDPAARIATLCALCLAALAISFALWTRLAAEVSYIFSTITIVDTFDRPLATGPALNDATRAPVIRELWRRRLVPPSLRQACCAPEEVVCRQVDTILARVPGMWSTRAYLEDVGTALISVLSVGVLSWVWTRRVPQA